MATATTTSSSYLAHARYGKDKVRVFRVVREGSWHHVVEYNVEALLEGDIESSYIEADNSVVIATDSIKNITYYLAKKSPHILSPERFALHLGTHLVSKYAHIHKAFVTIEKLRWTRIPIGENKQDHSHSFVRDGDEKRFVKVEIDASQGKEEMMIAKVEAGTSDLLVLKTTGSAFENFIRDEYTTLVEVNERILSTAVDLEYSFAPFAITPPSDAEKLEFNLEQCIFDGPEEKSAWDGEKVGEWARNVTLEVFAEDESASVQATLYKMGQRLITENDHISSVRYSLPNKHYIPVDMRYIGVDNMTPSNAEVFMPVAAPR